MHWIWVIHDGHRTIVTRFKHTFMQIILNRTTLTTCGQLSRDIPGQSIQKQNLRNSFSPAGYPAFWPIKKHQSIVGNSFLRGFICVLFSCLTTATINKHNQIILPRALNVSYWMQRTSFGPGITEPCTTINMGIILLHYNYKSIKLMPQQYKLYNNYTTC